VRIARRSREPEILDGPVRSSEELARSLAQVAQVNRWLGGNRSLRRHLSPLLQRDDVRLLDVGTGNGETMTELATWARRKGSRWRVTGLDIHGPMARLASRISGAPVVQADALRLPFGDDAFDASVCTLTLHHFDDRAAIELVREMARVSSGIVLVSDLERTLPNYVGARLLSLTPWRRNRLTRNDGPLSVLRSFTAAELERIGRASGLRNVQVRRHRLWRLVMEGHA